MAYKNSFRFLVDFLKVEGKDWQDNLKLRLLEQTYRECNWRTKAKMERLSWHKADKEFGEDGMVAVVWSGMDCDCVRYSGNAYIIPSDWRSIMDHINSTYEWADGPCHYYFEKPSVAEQIHRQSRDLAMEAFEDGHPHVVYV